MVRAKDPNLQDHTSGEVIKPGFVESPTQSHEYRRIKDTSIWHSHPDCASWPSSDYFSSKSKLTATMGKLCEECSELHE
jgi:proteasome lid subunit RPN8/RPN11